MTIRTPDTAVRSARLAQKARNAARSGVPVPALATSPMPQNRPDVSTAPRSEVHTGPQSGAAPRLASASA